MPKCNNCPVDIKWPEPYVQGARPLNMDGTEHSCKKAVAGAPKFEKTPIDQATQFFDKAWDLAKTIYSSEPTDPNTRARTICSLFDTLSRSYKL